ncbi:hypothetical protein ONZ43_g2326 [Nemania bipapillata]|uniref:Uncharacterized protein n=1 Tax=Nemania bipapillata TaxID=110536 RepID=A0ACC2J1D2_9PEZI|nr:hypothetical protein ONZ43_g2326 [Nemania bipapillata]
METATPTPALPPPPGQTSNFDHPASLRQQFDIGAGISIPLTTIFVFLRTYSRLWIKKTWILEDWFLLAAWAGTIILAGFGEATMSHYGGRHEWDITKAQGNEAAYWFNLCSIEYGIALFFAKIAVLQLYRRVFSPHRRSAFDNGIIATAVAIFLFHVASTIVKIFECTPRAKIYNSDIKGTCVNISVFLTAIGAVWSMTLPFHKKVIVVIVFTFGLAAPAFSLYGFVVRLKGTNNPDKNWNQPAIVMWGLLEIATAVLCASFPELGPIFLRRRKRIKPATSIVNGKYRYEEGGSGPKGKSIFATLSETLKGREETNTYFDLDTYGVQAVAQNHSDVSDATQQPGEITVTREVSVACKTADAEHYRSPSRV